MSADSDRTHMKVRKNRPPAFADFMDEVYESIPEIERESLPTMGDDELSYLDVIGPYVDAIVAYALDNVDRFSPALIRAVAGVYAQSPGGERFINDPRRTSKIAQAILFLDRDGDLVTVRNPEINWVAVADQSVLVMDSYQSYEVLTGAGRGKRFDSHSRALPYEPVPAPGSDPRTPKSESAELRKLRVFLCHAYEDKEAVRNLRQQLIGAGFLPWLDEEDILPGQNWSDEIDRAVRNADVVLVCLSTSSERQGYMQKEVRAALDRAEEQPEGTIYIVPVRLDDCTVPKRLERYQWVDLFTERGYQKLKAALDQRRESLKSRSREGKK